MEYQQNTLDPAVQVGPQLRQSKCFKALIINIIEALLRFVGFQSDEER